MDQNLIRDQGLYPAVLSGVPLDSICKSPRGVERLLRLEVLTATRPATMPQWRPWRDSISYSIETLVLCTCPVDHLGLRQRKSQPDHFSLQQFPAFDHYAMEGRREITFSICIKMRYSHVPIEKKPIFIPEDRVERSSAALIQIDGSHEGYKVALDNVSFLFHLDKFTLAGASGGRRHKTRAGTQVRSANYRFSTSPDSDYYLLFKNI
jgi:hypothetical protein